MILVEYGNFKQEIKEKATKFLFDLYALKSSRSSEHKTNLNYQIESRPSQLTDVEPLG